MESHRKDAKSLVPEDQAASSAATSDEQLIAFGRYRLDRRGARLLHGESGVALRLKSFSVLEYLVTHPNRLVTKSELLDAIWPETHVSGSVLTGCIREVRRALGDDPNHPHYVETVHGRGYRFIGDLICASGRFTIPTRWLTDASATAARDNELAALAREFAEAVVAVISRSMPKPPKH